MRTDGADVAAARLEALRRPAAPPGWVPEPDLLEGPADRLAGLRRPERFDDLPGPEPDDLWPGRGRAPGDLPAALAVGEPAPARVLVSRRAALAVAALALALVVGVAVRVGLAGDVQVTPAPGPTPSATGSPAAPAPILPVAASPATVVVDVAGQVGRPGLVTLPASARVADAVRAAGGARPGANLAALNLARHLVDGEQVLVPAPGQAAPAAAGPPASPGGTAAGGGLDLNSGTEEQFDALPGIGPVIAGRIVAWRQEHGRFTSVEELAEVQGIGDKLLSRLREQVRV